MNATYPLCMLYIPSDFLCKYIFFHTFVFEENNNDGEKYLDQRRVRILWFFVRTRDKYVFINKNNDIRRKMQINRLDLSKYK